MLFIVPSPPGTPVAMEVSNTTILIQYYSPVEDNGTPVISYSVFISSDGATYTKLEPLANGVPSYNPNVNCPTIGTNCSLITGIIHYIINI